jgi:hypothetical protein
MGVAARITMATAEAKISSDAGPVIRAGDGDHDGKAAANDSADAGAGHGRSDQELREARGRCPSRDNQHGQADDDQGDPGRKQAGSRSARGRGLHQHTGGEGQEDR